MGMNIEYPFVSEGSADAKINQIRDYLYQLTDKLNMQDFSAERVFEEAAKAIDAESVANTTNEQKAKLREYANLKALIIKTGEYAVTHSDEVSKVFKSSYGASSDFGDIDEELVQTVKENAEGIERLFNYTAGINRADGEGAVGIATSQFIKSGLLYYDNITPVFGVGVGVISTDLAKGEEVINLQKNRLATFTADEIAFWDNGNKVAYVSGNKIHFPAAEIRGGSIHIGQETKNFFKVDDEGNLTIGENFSVDNAGIAKFQSTDGKTTLDLSAGDISFEIDNEIHMKQSADGITFNKLDGGGGLTVFRYIGGISAYLNADIGSGLYPTARMSIFDVYDPSSSKVLGKFWDNGGTKSQLDVGGVYLRDSYDMNTEYAAFYTETGKSYLWVHDFKVKNISGREIAQLGINDEGNAGLYLGSAIDGLHEIASYDGSRHVHADHFHFHNKSDGLFEAIFSETDFSNGSSLSFDASEYSAIVISGWPGSQTGSTKTSMIIPVKALNTYRGADKDYGSGSIWQLADDGASIVFYIWKNGTRVYMEHCLGNGHITEIYGIR